MYTENFLTPFEYYIELQNFINAEVLKIVENSEYNEEDFNVSINKYLA